MGPHRGSQDDPATGDKIPIIQASLTANALQKYIQPISENILMICNIKKVGDLETKFLNVASNAHCFKSYFTLVLYLCDIKNLIKVKRKKEKE